MDSRTLCLLYATVLLASACSSERTIRRQYLEALEHQRAGRTLAAADAWADLIQRSPAIAGPRTNMAIAEFERGRTAQATRLLKQELRIHDDVFAARYALAVVQYRAERLDAALQTTRPLVHAHPQSPAANFLLASILYEQGSAYEHIRGPLQVVIEHSRSPDLQSRGLHLIGIAQLREGRLVDALQSIQRATMLRKDAVATYNLAVAYVAKGSLKNADKALDAAEDLDSSAHQIPLLRAHIAVNRNELDTARRYLTEAMRMQPKHTAQALAIEASISLSSSAYEEARDAWRKVTMLNPHQAAYWTNLGLASLHCDDIDESLVAFRKAHALAPSASLEKTIRQLQVMTDH